MIPLLKELEYFQDYQNKLRAYVGEAKAKEVITEALYIVSLGTNDFLENYYIFPQRRAHLSPTQFQDFLIGLAENFLRKLYNLGARKFSLTGLPPMGCLPLERTTNFPGHHDCVEEYNNVALEFNGKLSSLAIRLNRELPGIRILDAEAFKIFDQIIRKPDAYGKFYLSFLESTDGSSFLCVHHFLFDKLKLFLDFLKMFSTTIKSTHTYIYKIAISFV